MKKPIDIDDFEITIDERKYPYYSWEEIKRVLGEEEYKEFEYWMRGQTCFKEGAYVCDVKNYLRKPQNRFFD